MERSAMEHAGVAAGGVFAAIVVAAATAPLRGTVGNANLALVLVIVVVAAAAVGGRLAGAFTSVAAAVSYNFFHTQPYHSLTISNREDVVTVVLLLVVGLAVGELASLGSRSRARASSQAGGAHRLEQVAALVAAGAPVSELWPAVRDGLTAELHLRSCHFEPAPFVGRLPELSRSGRVEGPSVYAHEGFVLPAGGAQLLVQRDHRLLGRLVLEPTPERGLTLDERRVAVALADQLAVGLAASPPLAELR